jgi:hypothetical protein
MLAFMQKTVVVREYGSANSHPCYLSHMLTLKFSMCVSHVNANASLCVPFYGGVSLINTFDGITETELGNYMMV